MSPGRPGGPRLEPSLAALVENGGRIVLLLYARVREKLSAALVGAM